MVTRCCDTPEPTRLLVLADEPATRYCVSTCAACAGAVIEYYSFDDWDTGNPADFEKYWWWRMDAPDTAAFRDAIAACPAPLDGACRCPVHHALKWRTPNTMPPSRETPYEEAEVPRTRFHIDEGGAIRWKHP
ncbi:hypothetical protein E1293_35575 [Actinomadura darangshiensis]|uniref:Uncharacterized protein n=1 Tax=Actinomadura darangshiensis TaxID=705336 RepID=A0A4R5AI10_9ACTN|nr:hypothetical protein [Actinomadura darangshiensis]TDD69732.1 hypothetical protein E1293_35575 [Actinomadura darangshiensis]